MKWSELSDKDRVEYVITHAMRWKCFDSFKNVFNEIYKTGKYIAIEHPVAYWGEQDGQWRVSYKPDIPAEIFDPLHDMNDAMLIVEKLYENWDVTLEVHGGNAEGKYTALLSGKGTSRIEHFVGVDSSLNDAIMIVALAAHGVIFEQEDAWRKLGEARRFQRDDYSHAPKRP